jgi:hypothetical protein
VTNKEWPKIIHARDICRNVRFRDAGETYALAFEFFSMSLTSTQSPASSAVSWPDYPSGFILESTTNLAPPINWVTNNSATVVTNHLNWVSTSSTNAVEVFRLARP